MDLAIKVSEVGAVEDQGRYQTCPVHYEENGEEKIKKFNSLNAQEWKLKDSLKEGEKYVVTIAKNEKGFWNWTAVTPGDDVPVAKAGFVATPQKKSWSGKSGYTPANNDRFETKEERAVRQRLIVRQSSLSNALDYFKNMGEDSSPSGVMSLAQKFEEFVFSGVVVADKEPEKTAEVTPKKGRPKKVIEKDEDEFPE